MQNFISSFIWLLVITAFLATTTLADEVWKSNVGEIIYEKDIGNTAVLSYATPGVQNSTTRLFINNLVPDVYGGGQRGNYSGYWTDNSKRQVCEAAIVDPMGTRTNSWGRFEITFKKEGSWWAWTGSTSNCFGQPIQTIFAKPNMAENQNQTNFLITSNSVGTIRIGMTVAEARKAMSGVTFSRTEDGEGIALIAVKQGDKELMTIYAGEEDSEKPINENAKIEQIEVWSSNFKTAEGVHPKMKISDVEKIYGKIKNEFTSEIESRQFIEFTNEPKGFSFRKENTDFEALDKDIANNVDTEGKNYKVSPFILSITISKPF